MKRLVTACGVVLGALGPIAGGMLVAEQQGPLWAATPENAAIQPVKSPTALQLEQWLAELGSDDFALREQASDRLMAAGESAVELLAGAIGDKRPEVAWRAGEALRQISLSGDEKSLARVEAALTRLSAGRPGLSEVAAEIRARQEKRRHDRAAAALIALGGKLSQNGASDGMFAEEVGMLPPMMMAMDFGFVAPGVIPGGIAIEEEATIAEFTPAPDDEPASELEAGETPKLRTLIAGLFGREEPVAAAAVEAEAIGEAEVLDPDAFEGLPLAGPPIPVDSPAPFVPAEDAPPVDLPFVDAPPAIADTSFDPPAMPAPPPDVVPIAGFDGDLSLIIAGGLKVEMADGFIDAAFVADGAGGVVGALHDGGTGLGAESLRLDSSWRGGDEGLAALTDLPSIGIVHIVGAKLTDGALKHVAALPRLQHLHIAQTKFSSGALRQFRVSKPDASLSAPGEAMLGINADTDGGCVLTNIYPGSGAAAAGLKAGDSLLTVDGQKIADFTDLMIAVHPHSPGETIEIEYEREGKKLIAQVLLKARSELAK